MTPVIWRCPICMQSVTTHVPVVDAPTCHRHLRRIVRMVATDEVRS
jgi:hypothetical protein